jgi:energy-coupling factor transporter ATPase
MLSIHLENLSYTYHPGTPCEKKALRDLTFHIPPGMYLGIAGRSGSGKTTLLQHLNGLLTPSSGTILFDGAPAGGHDMRDLRTRIGLVFQRPEDQLFEETVCRDVAFGLSGRGLSVVETGNRVRKALEAVGLGEEFLERNPFELSHGEKRRVAIAGVIVTNPSVLVLDEPTEGLDPRGRREILDRIGALRKERGMTIILASHDLEQMARHVENVLVLDGGRLAAAGCTGEVFRDAGTIESAGLEPPRITRLMLKLKKLMPELHDEIFTVEHAAEELMRLYRRKGYRWSQHDDKSSHGPLHSGQFDAPQIGPEDKDTDDDRLYGACISC